MPPSPECHELIKVCRCQIFSFSNSGPLVHVKSMELNPAGISALNVTSKEVPKHDEEFLCVLYIYLLMHA